MDGRCTTCRWWGPLANDAAPNDGRLPSGWRSCTLTRYDERRGLPSHDGLARAIVDCGEWGAVETIVVTAPDFGCVQWETADAATVDQAVT